MEAFNLFLPKFERRLARLLLDFLQRVSHSQIFDIFNDGMWCQFVKEALQVQHLRKTLIVIIYRQEANEVRGAHIAKLYEMQHGLANSIFKII